MSLPANQNNEDGSEPDLEVSLPDVVARLDRLWSRDNVTKPFSLNDPLGQSISKYEIRKVIGCGAFGVVYLARDAVLDRDVALKLPRPEVMLEVERLRRFQGEATTAAALDHPAIVPVYEADLSGPVPYIATAYCDGPDLGEWLRGQSEPVPDEQAAEFVAQLAEAVEYAHQQGILHRDLKPSNVLLESTRPLADDDRLAHMRPRLTDFGLAKVLRTSSTETKSSLVIGTPLYMSPEQLGGEVDEQTPRTDVYSLGVILFELLTLTAPIEGSSYSEVLDRIRSTEPQRIKQFNPHASKELQTVCDKCMAKDPSERYESAASLRDDLRRFLLDKPLAAKPVTHWGRFLRWTRQTARLRQAGAFAFGLQSAVLGWLIIILLVGIFSSLYPDGAVRRSIPDLLSVCLLGHLPLALLGRSLLRGMNWAFWPGMIGSLLMLFAVAHSITSEQMLFEYNYPTTHSKVSTFVGLLLGLTVQCVLYILAIPAWRRTRR